MPAITICPVQALDQLHHASILLNRLKHRCVLDTGQTNHLGLPQCDDEAVVNLTKPGSPIHGLMQDVKDVTMSWARGIREPRKK